jgi:hypothetical protein
VTDRSNDHKLIWVRLVAAALEARRDVHGSPRGDIEWLLLRCQDTTRYQDELQRDSIRQLEADVSAFAREFPDELPRELVPASGG